MTKKPGRSAADKPTAPELLCIVCPGCGERAALRTPGTPLACPRCSHQIGRVAQLDQLLAQWYEPRRWRADLVRPSVPYLVERLWTANGQGERLYVGVSPKYTNFDIFRHLVTRLIVSGIDEGWAIVTFPPNPLIEDPQYELQISDSERFARGVEKLFPEVDWDEPVEVPFLAHETPPGKKLAKRRRKAAR